jgi:replicative DNA helicase
MKSMPGIDLSQPRLPPQNVEAEQAILGAVLLDKEAMPKVEELLVDQDFYRTGHQRIYRAMLTLSERDEAIDQITLTEHLRGTGDLESVGGAAYLAELVAITPSAANVRYHCRVVKDKALLRNLISSTTDVLTRAYDAAESAEELLESAEQAVFRIGESKLGQGFYPLKDVIKESLDVVDALHKLGKSVTGVPTGFTELDDLTAGLQPSDLVILAARPSMGKTSLALGMAINAAVKYGQKVGIFSLEMSKEQLVLRMLSSYAAVDSHKLRIGKLEKTEWWKLAEAASKLEPAPIFIDDSGSLSVTQMRGKTRRLIKEKGLDLLIVDYLQLMQGRPDAESRQQEISDISRSLKSLAKELKVPILALSQLSRAVENRTDKKPILADLRESGAIEQDADVVIFIYRDEVYNPETEEKGIAHIMVKKHRNGPTGDVSLTFLDKYAKFADFSDREQT